MYLSNTFKQAQADGLVEHSQLSVSMPDGDEVYPGYVTQRFGVPDAPTAWDARNPDDRYYTVTELKTGFAMALFSAHHVALNFMLAMEHDIEPSANFQDVDYVRCYIAPYIKRRRLHPSSFEVQ